MSSRSRTCTSVLFALTLGFMPLPSALAAPTFSLSTPNATPLVGVAFEVDVIATDLVDLYGYEFDLTFGPAVIQSTSVTEGGFLATAGGTFFDPGVTDNVAGSISFVFDTLIGPIPGASGSGVLVRFGFLPVGVGTTTLSLANVLALDSQLNQINVATTDLTIRPIRTTTVPEPGTCALLVLALAGFAGSARRRGARQGFAAPRSRVDATARVPQ